MGLRFLCFLLLFYAEVSSVSAALRLYTAAESDQRISLMTEVVSGIRADTWMGRRIQRKDKKYTKIGSQSLIALLNTMPVAQ